MKYTLILTALLLCGCGESQNRAFNRQAVVEKFKTTDVYNVKDYKYEFIVRTKDGSVWWVETYSADPQNLISVETQLFGPIKP